MDDYQIRTGNTEPLIYMKKRLIERKTTCLLKMITQHIRVTERLHENTYYESTDLRGSENDNRWMKV